MPKSMVFHQNSNRYSYTKSRHAEGKWMKQHTEIDDFLCTSVHFGWFFGGRRFLVLIIKVTLSELSEASAPSNVKNYKNAFLTLFLLDTRGHLGIHQKRFSNVFNT